MWVDRPSTSRSSRAVIASGCSPATLGHAGVGEVGEGEAEVGAHVGADRVAGEHPGELPLGQVVPFERLERLDREPAEPLGELGARHGASQSAIAPRHDAPDRSGPSCTITRWRRRSVEPAATRAARPRGTPR